MDLVVERFDIYLVRLDPTVGSEIRKTRPCLIISPNEMNLYLSTVVAAPLTTSLRRFPSRVTCEVQNKPGQVALDQIRTVDKSRLLKKLGTLSPDTQREVIVALQHMFAE